MFTLNVDVLFEFLARFSWLITIFVIALAFWRSLKEVGLSETFTIKRGGWILSRRPITYITVSVIITLIAMAIVFVQPQNNAIVVSAISRDGIRRNPLNAGLHFIVPLLERAVNYPIYNQSFSISRSGFERGETGIDDSISARSKTGQEIFLDATLIYRLNPDRLNEVHIAWQNRYLEQLVRPLVRSYVRTAASQLTVEQIVSTDRIEMQDAILTNLREGLAKNGIVADSFVIRDVSFNPGFAAAVEAKVITEQEALQAEIAIQTRLKQAEQIRTLAQGEADAVVIKAQADAEALALVNQVLQENPEVLNYEYIKRLAPNIRLLLLDSGNPVILPLSTDMIGGDTELVNPLIPQMPPSGLAPDGSVIEPQMPPSGLAPDEEIEEDELSSSSAAADSFNDALEDFLRPPAGQ